MLTKQTKLRRELGHSFQLHLIEIRNRRLRPVGDTRMPSGCVIEFKLFLPYRVVHIFWSTVCYFGLANFRVLAYTIIASYFFNKYIEIISND